MTTVTITQLRTQIRKLANQVAHHGERICVERNGEPAFAMVSLDDMEALEALEDRMDIEAAKKALREGSFTDLEGLAKELGI